MATIWQPGTRVQDRWHVYKVLRGGMGLVYIVYDHGYLCPFALKTIHEELLGQHPDLAERFKQEALVWTSLDSHPNIAKAVVFREIEGRPFLVLEYVSGGDLSQWIGTPRLTRDAQFLLRLAIQFCDGMIHAHSKGLKAHRDIKPQNCLLTEDETLKVTDFGLAKVFDDAPLHWEHFAPQVDRTSSIPANGGSEARFPAANLDWHVTKTGGLAGTLTHMAPEQFEDVKRVDARADVYAFGVMLFQMASGRLPFHGRTLEDWTRLHRTEAPPVLENHSPALNSIVEMCLAKDPAHRFADFRELRDRLAELYERLIGKPSPQPVSGARLTASDWFHKACSLNYLGLIGEALSSCERALELDPTFPQAWFGKGNSLRKLGRSEEAIGCFDKALELDPKIEKAWCNKGCTLNDLGRSEEALTCLNRALDLDPADEFAWNNKLAVLIGLARYKEALSCCEPGLQLHPASGWLWSKKGRALFHLGKTQEASACFETALARFKPGVSIDWLAGLAEAHYWMGMAFRASRKYGEACASFDAALKANPSFPLAWREKGNSCLDLQRLDEALECFDRALQLNPRELISWFNKGNALESLIRFDEALTCYQRVLEINPREFSAWCNQGGVLRSLDRAEEAIRCYDRAIQIDPNFWPAWYNKGCALEELFRRHEALASYQSALEINPELSDTWMQKGKALALLGLGRESLACYEQAQRLGHPNAAHGQELARYLIEKNSQAQQEIIQCDRILSRSPSNESAWFRKAEALASLNQIQEALVCSDEVLRINSRNRDAWTLKARLFFSALHYRESEQCLDVAAQLGHPEAPKLLEAVRVILSRCARWMTQAMSLQQEQRWEEARECYACALELNPRYEKAWYNKAAVASAAGDFDEGLASYDRALELNPQFADAWYNKGILLVNAGRIREGIPCFEEAKRLSDRQADGVLAQCRSALGE